jgi:hypothetical protein
MLHSDNFMVDFKIEDYYYYYYPPKKVIRFPSKLFSLNLPLYGRNFIAQNNEKLKCFPIPTIVELLRGNFMTLCLIE